MIDTDYCKQIQANNYTGRDYSTKRYQERLISEDFKSFVGNMTVHQDHWIHEAVPQNKQNKNGRKKKSKQKTKHQDKPVYAKNRTKSSKV